MSFRERLKLEISYKGLVLKEIANQTEISKRTLDSYVDSRAAMPPADVAVRLSQALGVTVEYLVTGENFSLEKEIPNYMLIKKLLCEINKISLEGYKNIEPYLLATVKAVQEQEQALIQKKD